MMINLGIGVIVVLGILFMMSSSNNGVDSPVDEERTSENTVQVPIPVTTPSPVDSGTVNFGAYNIDYMNDNVKAILIRKLGASGKTAFYLPAVGYMNVSRGTKYGVAFVIQNVNPKVPEGNEFAYNFDVDPTSVDNCGVSVDVAQSWIERGWASSGMISGQWREDWNEWYDAMTVYFAFPDDIDACNIRYDFVITRDGIAYDSKVLEFNLI